MLTLLGRALVELGSRSEGLGRVFDRPRYKYLKKKSSKFLSGNSH